MCSSVLQQSFRSRRNICAAVFWVHFPPIFMCRIGLGGTYVQQCFGCIFPLYLCAAFSCVFKSNSIWKYGMEERNDLPLPTQTVSQKRPISRNSITFDPDRILGFWIDRWTGNFQAHWFTSRAAVQQSYYQRYFRSRRNTCAAVF